MTKLGGNTQLGGLDAFDCRILECVQRDNQMSHNAIGEAVGLSASAVRKRLAALRKSGVIIADVALVKDDPSYIHILVTLTLEQVTSEAHEAITALIDQTDEIVEAFHIAGREDFILIMRCPSLAWYENWSMKAFVSNPVVGAFDSRVAWSRMKYSTSVVMSGER